MNGLIAAAVMGLVSVVCLEPVSFNGKLYKIGQRIDGLTEAQADQLIDMDHAEPAPANLQMVPVQDSAEAQIAAEVALRVNAALAEASQSFAELQAKLEQAEAGKAEAETALSDLNKATADQGAAAGVADQVAVDQAAAAKTAAKPAAAKK